MPIVAEAPTQTDKSARTETVRQILYEAALAGDLAAAGIWLEHASKQGAKAGEDAKKEEVCKVVYEQCTKDKNVQACQVWLGYCQ